MRVLVIGYGSMGKRHAHNARELGHEAWISEYDLDACSRASGDGFRVMGAPAEVFAPDCDAVIIATPARTHYEVARSLRSAGYSGALMVEKPLDTTTDNADFWRSWPHPTAMVGYNWRFVEGVAPLRAERGIHALTRTNIKDWPGGDYANPVLECSHDIELVRHALGGDVFIEGASIDERAFDVTLRAERGIGYVFAWWDSDRAVRSLQIDGESRYLFDDADSIAAAVEPSYRAELAAFLQAAEQGTPVPDAATFEDGLAVIEIVEQAEKLCSVRSAP